MLTVKTQDGNKTIIVSNFDCFVLEDWEREGEEGEGTIVYKIFAVKIKSERHNNRNGGNNKVQCDSKVLIAKFKEDEKARAFYNKFMERISTCCVDVKELFND